MNISDSFIKAQLKNVYWIAGAGYGGKSTMTDLIAEKYGFLAYHPEEHFHEHKVLGNAQDHPYMVAPFHGWEWFFNRPTDEYVEAILQSSQEQLEMVVLEAIRMSASTPVVVDAFGLDPKLALRITDPDKCIYLFADENTIRNGFYNREDKADLVEVINTLSNPEKTFAHVLDVSCHLSATKQSAAIKAGLRVLVRDTQTPLTATLTQIEQHFGLA